MIGDMFAEKINPLLMTIAAPLPALVSWFDKTNAIITLITNIAAMVAGICIAAWWVRKLWEKFNKRSEGVTKHSW